MIKLLIFDFDGVIADSFDSFYSLIKDGMKKIGLSLTPKQYQNLFIGNVHQGFKDFINDEQRFLIFSEFRKANYDKYYYDKNNKIKLFSGASEFLKRAGKRHILTVASSGKRSNIINLLKKNGAYGLFDIILADSKTSKKSMLKEILDKFGVRAEETIMITDTVGDILMAKKLFLQTIAVTWGFHSIKMLKSAKPDYFANNFKMLYKILRHLPKFLFCFTLLSIVI